MSEHLQVTPDGPGISGHPELEELAALADGKLPRADAARVRAHLGSCEECYEVFAETLHLMEELAGEKVKPGGNVLPFPFDRKTWPRWAAAAAALLVIGIGVGLWQSRDSWRAGRGETALSVSALAKSYTGRAADLAWGERLRGKGEKGSAGEALSFQVGVALLNLQAALVSEERTAADTAEAQLNGILGIEGSKNPQDGTPAASNAPLLDASLRVFYANLRGRLQHEPLQSLAKETARQAEALRSSSWFESDQAYLDLGAWTEAGRLAAAQRRSFPQKEQASRLLRQLEKNKEADLPDEVVQALKTIGNLPAEKHSDLKSAFEEILKHYYPQGQPFEESP